MSTRTTLATVFLSAALAGAAAPALGQETGPTYKVDVPRTVEVDTGISGEGGTTARTYLVLGLSTAAVIGLLLLVVLLARAGDGTGQPHHAHRPH